MSKIIGIDISKQTFDVCYINDKGNRCWSKYANDLKGFRQFGSAIDQGAHCIMEASGPYYLKLAYFLHATGMKVSVVNPLVINRYSQMLMSRAKTDKKDAEIICRYGISQQPGVWKPKEEIIVKMQQITTTIEAMQKQLRITLNQQSAFGHLPVNDNQVLTSLKKIIKALQLEIDKLEERLMTLASSVYQSSIERLTSIPGVGKKMAVALIVATNDFKNFDSSRKLVSYVGFSPRIYQSGTSLKGKGRISRMGKSRLRKLLYLCSMSARTYNVHCKKFYERLKANGKNGKVAIVAIANKLLRQAFSIMKNQTFYEENILNKACF